MKLCECGCGELPNTRRGKPLRFLRGHQFRNAKRTTVSEHERFLRCVRYAGECLVWTGGKTYGGYGVFWFNGKCGLAHRYSYEKSKGQIPEGLQIDHICNNRSCVNPDHLRAISSAENNARSTSPTAKNIKKTHCPSGHPYIIETMWVIRGKRICKLCHQRRAKELRMRKEGATL